MFLVRDNRHNTEKIMSEKELRKEINGLELDRIRVNNYTKGLYGLTKEELINNDYNICKLIEMYVKEDYTLRRLPESLYEAFSNIIIDNKKIVDLKIEGVL